MLKGLHRNDTQITPFIVTKNWELSNVTNEDLILMEHSGSAGSPVALEYLDYGIIEPEYLSACNIALENQHSDVVSFKKGLKISGIFYPDVDPQNQDGTYQRVIYSQVSKMFYNNYKDPTKIWGSEDIDFEKSQTKKFIADKFKLFEIPKNLFGEKILENTVTLIDTTTDNDYIITDDGHCNLFAGYNLFSTQQEIGIFLNEYLSGSDGFCDIYNTINIPDAPILYSTYDSYLPSIYLNWNINGWPVTKFVIERSTDGINYITIQSSSGYFYLDTNITYSYTYSYKIYAENYLGTSSFSNINNITASDDLYWDTSTELWDTQSNSVYWDS